MIGNDVVDLKLAKTQSNWQRKRFLEKQFTDFEINEIQNSQNPFELVWLFWSMKEAAYKCYMQTFKKRFFAPQKFSCKLLSNTEGLVFYDDISYSLKYYKSNKYIHSFASDNSFKNLVDDLFFIDKVQHQTKITNENLLKNFSIQTTLQKDEFGIPYLLEFNKKLPFSISTSHHGNYGAYAISNL